MDEAVKRQIIFSQASRLVQEWLSTYDHLEVSLNNLVRSRQHIRWNRETDLLRGLQIDQQLELRRLLDWQVSRFCTLQDPVDHQRRALVRFNPVGSVGH